MRLIIAVATMAFALSACNHTPPMPTQAFTEHGVTMKLTPPAAPDCKPNTAYHATLEWSVSPTDTPKTDVRIGSPKGALFARSNDVKGHADTGDWVKPGTWFLLLDRRSGKLLGALQAGPKPCP